MEQIIPVVMEEQKEMDMVEDLMPIAADTAEEEVVITLQKS